MKSMNTCWVRKRKSWKVNGMHLFTKMAYNASGSMKPTPN